MTDRPDNALPPRRTAIRTWGCFIVLLGLLLAAAWVSNGRPGLEKAITRLVLPIGLIWLATGWGVLYVFIGRRWALGSCLFLVWLIFSALGSGVVSELILRRIEATYAPYQPEFDGELDVLVVLGGGTNLGPRRAQAGESGDRVLLAAQLYLQGHAKLLITTGDALPDFRAQPRSGPREQTFEIWRQLGVPAASIEQLAGINTYQEIQSLKSRASSLADQRVGLLTSAYHLPRAMRLAEAEGLQSLVPVPADFQARRGAILLIDLIPTARSLEQFARCQHELMAAWVGR